MIFMAALLLGSRASAPKPHIMMLLVDDLGWANVGWHRDPPAREVQTPVMDGLVRDGIELDRHYVYKFCSPTRSALQSGRNPIHVNTVNTSPLIHNPADPVSGFQGIPRNMTGVATKLKAAGYATHMAGKWDAGMATPDHSPKGRGYDTSLHYFHHCNDYWTGTAGSCPTHGIFGKDVAIVDLWDTDGPSGQNGSSSCGTVDQPPAVIVACTTCRYGAGVPAGAELGPFEGTGYEDDLFTGRVMSTLEGHDPITPLFFFWAPHTVHIPLQVPQSYVDQFAFVDNPYRKVYHAMVKHLDDDVGTVVDELKRKGMWNNTLLVMSSDNGGPIYANGTSGANNWPLRGGKMTNFEGGIRAAAFVSGGFVPAARRGTKESGITAIWDWYATWCTLAGVSSVDTRAAAADLPAVDGVDLWPLLSGATSTSPRTQVALGSPPVNFDGTKSISEVNGLISGQYKILIGRVAQASWTGPQYPNASTNYESNLVVLDCTPGSSNHTKKACLFDLLDDPTEHIDLFDAKPAVAARLLADLTKVQPTAFQPDRGRDDGAACKVAVDRYHGYYGPFLP